MPVPQVLEEIVAVVRSALRADEQLIEVLAVHVVDVPVPHSEFEEIVEVVRLVSQERVQQMTDKQLVGVPVLQRIVEQSVGVFAPLFMEVSIQVSKSVPQEQISERLYEQIVEVSFPQVVERLVQIPKIPVPERTMPVPQVLEANDEAGVKQIFEGIMQEALGSLSLSGIPSSTKLLRAGFFRFRNTSCNSGCLRNPRRN